MDAMRILDRTVRHFRTLSILFPSASSIRHIQVSKDVRRLGKRFQQQKANSLEPESAAQNNSPGLRTGGVAGCARGDKLGRASAVQLPEDLNWKQWEVQGSGQTWQASA